jgi:hypothetical protein
MEALTEKEEAKKLSEALAGFCFEIKTPARD